MNQINSNVFFQRMPRRGEHQIRARPRLHLQHLLVVPLETALEAELSVVLVDQMRELTSTYRVQTESAVDLFSTYGMLPLPLPFPVVSLQQALFVVLVGECSLLKMAEFVPV